jgi:hypothetical protein
LNCCWHPASLHVTPVARGLWDDLTRLPGRLRRPAAKPAAPVVELVPAGV